MPTIHRRTLLAALAVAGASGAAAGCTDRSGSPRRREASTPDPQLVDLADERELLAAYDATIARHASLQARLAPLRDHHAQHVAALERAVGRTPSGPSAGGSASGTPARTNAADAGRSVPPDPQAALAALRGMERSAATARAGSCAVARLDRAPLLGSIAACEASHEILLT